MFRPDDKTQEQLEIELLESQLVEAIKLIALCKASFTYIQRSDKTPRYDYGRNKKRDALPNGEFCKDGSRWITPAEKAWATTQDINKFLKKIGHQENDNE